jgi:hypothetical protein
LRSETVSENRSVSRIQQTWVRMAALITQALPGAGTGISAAEIIAVATLFIILIAVAGWLWRR